MLFDYLPKAPEGQGAREGDAPLACRGPLRRSEVFEEREGEAKAEKADRVVLKADRVRAASSEKQVQRPSAQVVEVASQPVWGAFLEALELFRAPF